MKENILHKLKRQRAWLVYEGRFYVKKSAAKMINQANIALTDLSIVFVKTSSVIKESGDHLRRLQELTNKKESRIY